MEVSRYNGEIQLIADKIELAEKAQAQLTDQTCYLKITRDVETNHLQRIVAVARKHRGRVPVVLFYMKATGKSVADGRELAKKTKKWKESLGTCWERKIVVFK